MDRCHSRWLSHAEVSGYLVISQHHRPCPPKQEGGVQVDGVQFEIRNINVDSSEFSVSYLTGCTEGSAWVSLSWYIKKLIIIMRSIGRAYIILKANFFGRTSLPCFVGNSWHIRMHIGVVSPHYSCY